MKKILLILTVLFSFSVFSQKQTNGKIYIEHPAIDVVNEFNKAYISGDLDKLRELVTDDVKVWRLRNRESNGCLLYTSPSPRDLSTSRMPSSA